ncbi:hypothetical protein D3C80_575370 [compost metagenome]
MHLLQPIVVQLGNLDVGGEDRHADGDLVARRDQMVLAQGVEDIGHRRRPALGGEDVERPDKAVRSSHFIAQIMADDDLGQLQHPVGHRIVAAQNPFAHLIEEGARIQTQLVADVGDGAGQKLHPLGARVLARIDFEAVLDPRQTGETAQPLGHVGEGALRLAHGEQTQPPEAMSRRRGQEVGIAAPGVQHQPVLDAGGQLDQFVLQLKRAELGQFFVLGMHRTSPVGG